MAQETVIDLGLVGGSGQVPDTGIPHWPRQRRWRTGVAACVALLCLTGLAGSSRARWDLGDPLWTATVGAGGFVLGPHSLYPARLGPRAVVALDLATGHERWRLDTIGVLDSVVDVGGGVAAVMSWGLTGESGIQNFRTTFVRDSTGTQVGHAKGRLYAPNVAGQPVLVFSARPPFFAAGCPGADTSCVEITGWDAGTGSMAWHRSVPSGATVIPSMAGDRIDGWAELDASGAITLWDPATGAALGTIEVPADSRVVGYPLVDHDAVLAMLFGPGGVRVTSYRRPALTERWTMNVPVPSVTAEGGGQTSLVACGSDACLTVAGVGTRIIDMATGAAGPLIDKVMIGRLGDGAFLASPLATTVPDRSRPGYVLDRTGQVLAELGVTGLVSWHNSIDAGLLIQVGRDRTGFIIVDREGQRHSLGSVPGTGLTCRAQDEFLACSDLAGVLRVWRLPY